MGNFWINFLIWLAVYAVAWIVWQESIKRGKDYRTAPYYATVYFLAACLIHYLLFPEIFQAYFTGTKLFALYAVIIGSLVANWLVHAQYHKSFTKPGQPKPHKLGTGIWSKHFEILFQQISFLVLAYLVSANTTYPTAIYLTAAIFFVLHLPVLYFISKPWALYYSGFSIVGGLMFAYILHACVYGLAVNYLIHTLFYAVTAGVVWKRAGTLREMR
jgi:hypothetical protein